MGKNVGHLVAAVLLLGLTSSVQADLIARWTFNNNTNDEFGNLTWALNGGAAYSTESKEGSHSVRFDGVDDYLNLTPTGALLDAFSTKTSMLWFKADSVEGTQILYDEGGSTNGLAVRINNGMLETAVQNSHVTFSTAMAFSSTDWTHVAVSFDNGLLKLFVDGVEVASVMGTFTTVGSHSNVAGIGARASQDAFDNTSLGDYFGGLIDDVQIFGEALTEAAIQEIALGRPRPWNPSPADGSAGVNSPLFTWTPGGTAQWHDLYLGTDPDLGPDDLVSPRMVFPMYWHTPGLEPGQTYYWRVDAVEAGGTVWEGHVWSFVFASMEAYLPDPANGLKYLDPNVVLTWRQGLKAVTHDVYLGTDETAVAEGTGDTFKGVVFPTSFQTTDLKEGMTYYWRIDEADATGEKVKGHVWSFSTVPDIPATDPDLLCWWKLDEGMGSRVVDWSGQRHHGVFFSEPQWVEGYDGLALNFDDVDDSVTSSFADETWSAFTVAVWVKADLLMQANNSAMCSTYQTTAGGFQLSFDAANNYQYHADVDLVIGPASLGWVHLAVTYDGSTAAAYYNGVFVANFTPSTDDLLANKFAIGVNRAEDNWFDGSVDDFRAYSRALTQEEIELVMRIDSLRAWQPSPADGSMADIRTATPLTWTKGDNASKHDVYFGTEEAAVAAADATDATGLYRSRISATSYTPSEGVDWGRKYFWRIDEVNTDGSITAGKVWSFTVAEHLIVDDFESYTDLEGSRIYETWIDGWTNGTGAVVGNLVAPFAEQTIVFDGAQAMPLDYNNIDSPWYSEAERSWASAQNWTFGDVNTLIVHFRGQAPEFIETGGTITMGAAGTDIWNTADEFRYAWKRLNGDGSIIARVDSIANTNVWAKGGVMIRESLDPGSRHAMVVATPASGVAFQRRLINNDVSIGTTQSGVVAPRWVKLTRSGNTFTAQHSADGVTWTDVVNATNPTSDTVVMGGTVYIGLALTSHAAGVASTAQFSEIKTTGNVTGQWQVAEIGVDHPGNSPESLYVAVEDSAGKVAVVTHPDPAATTLTNWQPWTIDLDSLSGVNLRSVMKLYIGAGDRANPSPDGAGRVYVDEIWISKGVSVEPNELATP